ncbi:hypothetical protein TNCV_1270671 [Trichonephila clavipes]|nr:hypothetical protein TNCV_1270671 [Trichonephila clavipes]
MKIRQQIKEFEMKFVEKEVPVCRDQSLMILSEDVSVKVKYIAQLKADAKKLKGRFQIIVKAHSSPKNGEMSNKPM